MNAKQSLYEKIKDGTFSLLTDAEIARKLRLGRREGLAVRGCLDALVREGKLFRDSRGRYGTAKQFGAKTGSFTGNARGFGFFTAEDGGELFIPRRAAAGALHGDAVLAMPVRGRSEDEGEILAVLSRGMREVAGVYRTVGAQGVLYPDEKRFCAEIAIPRAKSLGCKNGDKAVAKICAYRADGPEGEIVEIFGKSGELFPEEAALLRAHELRQTFPADVKAEARSVAAPALSEKDFAGREDLRGELIITVDGEDTRDIDDAISVRKNADGTFSLGVHIADVSAYVRPDGALDREAFARGTSVYFPDRVLPMLPEELSNGVCSLNEGADRLTLSCLMTVDADGRTVKKRLVPSVIRSRHRMTYREVAALAEGEKAACAKYPDLAEFTACAAELTRILQRARHARGGIALDVKEAKILYTDGKIILPDNERKISHEMIEQFMVLANESVAELMTEADVPFVYRVHERPAPEKAESLRDFLNGAGIAVSFDPQNVVPRDYAALVSSLEGSPLSPVVSRVMLRSMMKAKYAPENCGHFGLASPCYCHFTSPIRRYPDLAVHRIVKETLKDPARARERFKKAVAEIAAQSTRCEKRAAEAERDVDALYLVAYMQEKIGEEYGATVSGVTSFGLFAEADGAAEGFIPVETLPDDYYLFDEARCVLRGTKNSFRLGERIRIAVAAVDWGARRTQFTLLEKMREK